MPTNKEMEKIVRELTEKVNTLTEIVMGIVERKKLVEETVTSTVPNIKIVDLPPEKVDNLPVPGKWRAKVDEILGKSFEAEVTDGASGDYLMIIYIPDELDRRPGGERTGRDRSNVILHRATDMADLERWCNKIKDNILLTYPNTQLPL